MEVEQAELDDEEGFGQFSDEVFEDEPPRKRRKAMKSVEKKSSTGGAAASSRAASPPKASSSRAVAGGSKAAASSHAPAASSHAPAATSSKAPAARSKAAATGGSASSKASSEHARQTRAARAASHSKKFYDTKASAESSWQAWLEGKESQANPTTAVAGASDDKTNPHRKQRKKAAGNGGVQENERGVPLWAEAPAKVPAQVHASGRFLSEFQGTARKGGNNNRHIYRFIFDDLVEELIGEKKQKRLTHQHATRAGATYRYAVTNYGICLWKVWQRARQIATEKYFFKLKDRKNEEEMQFATGLYRKEENKRLLGDVGADEGDGEEEWEGEDEDWEEEEFDEEGEEEGEEEFDEEE